MNFNEIFESEELSSYESSNDEKWDYRFLELCKLVSSWSKDPSTKVGAVIVDQDKRVVSLGYNGFPKGVNDFDSRYDDRSLKYKYVVHAERNAIVFAKTDLKDCIIYTWPLMPCSACAGIIIQSGIKKVISVVNDNERWSEEFEFSKQMFNEVGIELELKKRFE